MARIGKLAKFRERMRVDSYQARFTAPAPGETWECKAGAGKGAVFVVFDIRYPIRAGEPAEVRMEPDLKRGRIGWFSFQLGANFHANWERVKASKKIP